MSRKKKLLLLSFSLFLVLILSVGYSLGYLNFFDEKSKFIGTWQILEDSQQDAFVISTVTFFMVFYENNSLEHRATVDGLMYSIWGIYSIEDNSKLNFTLNEQVTVDYHFTNNNRILYLSNDDFTLKLQKTTI